MTHETEADDLIDDLKRLLEAVPCNETEEDPLGLEVRVMEWEEDREKLLWRIRLYQMRG